MAFVLTSAIVICTPGPTVLLVIADALAHHKRHAWSTVLGVGAGDLVGMGLSLAGAGAVLRASDTAFTVLKVIGGLYLIYLGARSISSTRNRASRTSQIWARMASRSAAHGSHGIHGDGYQSQADPVLRGFRAAVLSTSQGSFVYAVVLTLHRDLRRDGDDRTRPFMRILARVSWTPVNQIRETRRGTWADASGVIY